MRQFVPAARNLWLEDEIPKRGVLFVTVHQPTHDWKRSKRALLWVHAPLGIIQSYWVTTPCVS
jgi:hypothetical protein